VPAAIGDLRVISEKKQRTLSIEIKCESTTEPDAGFHDSQRSPHWTESITDELSSNRHHPDQEPLRRK
jgi:hypothetical protein